MNIKSLEPTQFSLKFFEDQLHQSTKSILVMKQFLTGVHGLCKKFGEDLQQLFQVLSVQVEDEETLAQNTIVSNYILSISQIIRTRSDLLYEEAIEPFLQFEQNYNQINANLTGKFASNIEQMQACHEILKIKSEEYYEGKSKKPIFSTETQESQYRLAVQNMNTQWETYFKEMPQHFENFQLNDESRLTVAEQTYCKFVELLEYLFQQPSQQAIRKLRASFQAQREKFRSKDLYSDLVSLNHKMIDFFSQPKCEVFVSRDEYFRKQTALLLQSAEQQKSQGFQEEDYRIIKQSLYETLNKPTTIVHKLRQMPTIGFKDREELIQQLSGELKGRCTWLESNFQMKLFKILFIRLFRSFDNDYQSNQKYVVQLLHMITLSLQIQYSKEVPILAVVSQHCEIFFAFKIWKQIYEELMTNLTFQRLIIEWGTRYVKLEICNAKIILPVEAEQQKEKYFGLFKDKTRKISIQETLSLMNLIFIASHLHVQMSSQLMIELLRANNMRLSDFIHLIELQESNNMLRKLKAPLMQPMHKIYKWKTLPVYCFMKALKYLDFKDNFHSVLLVSKTLYKQVHSKMIKYYLCSRLNVGLDKRVMLWNHLLESDASLTEIQQKYLVSSKKLSREMERSILVDIKRSFVSALDKKEQIMSQYEIKLENLLRLHAFDNPEVSYYQGMNMLMVFLLYVTDLNEELAFKFFRALLDKLLRDIFLEGLKSMRLQFYILDRLIAIHLPRLFVHWKKLKIESPQFATAWYVTLFTNSIQLENRQLNETCFQLFDLIVAKGWSGFYTGVMSLLSFYEQRLIGMDFDETQKFLNHLPKSAFNQLNPMGDLPPFTEVKGKKLRISKQVIQQIEKEYYQIREKIDQINLQHL